jgi:hypothetical protein
LASYIDGIRHRHLCVLELNFELEPSSHGFNPIKASAVTRSKTSSSPPERMGRVTVTIPIYSLRRRVDRLAIGQVNRVVGGRDIVNGSLSLELGVERTRRCRPAVAISELRLRIIMRARVSRDDESKPMPDAVFNSLSVCQSIEKVKLQVKSQGNVPRLASAQQITG